MVGQLYASDDDRRDGGYTLYYMGINIGSIIGYIVTGYLMENAGYHWGFGAAAVGMAFGLIQYKLTQPKLGNVGVKPPKPLNPKAAKISWSVIWVLLAFLAIYTFMALNDYVGINPIAVAESVSIVFTIIFFVFYLSVFLFGKLTRDEMKRLGALFLVCIASTMFWAGFEQAGSSFNLFARDLTDRMVGDFEIPTTWFQSLNSIFLVIMSPFFAALWINLSKRMINPSYGFKSAIGLIIMATGFIVMFFASQAAASGLKVAPYWLVAVYFIHTVGELCLSPVALSAVSKLSPKRMAGQMMGIFVLTYSIGNVVAGRIAGGLDPNNPQAMPELYWTIFVFGVSVGAVVFVLALFTRKWEKLAPDDGEDEHPGAVIDANEPVSKP